MAEKSISHCQGKGSLAHNNREFRPKNVDSSRTPDNVTFVKIPIAQAYESLFGAAVERYNARQKRNDRKIHTSYYEYQFNHKVSQSVIESADKRHSFYEDVVQIGTMSDTGVGTPDARIAAECLTEYMNGFQARCPNFYVFNAVLHLDEATPHLHIDYIPVGHYSRGVDTQNGIAQALKEMGYGYGKESIARWRKSEYEVLREICIRHGLEISAPKQSRGSMTVETYKEVKRLEEQLAPLQEYERIADETEIPYKKALTRGNVVISKENLEKISEEKKAAAVQREMARQEQERNDEREKHLDEREQAVCELESSARDRMTEAEEYSARKHAEADEYARAKQSEADKTLSAARDKKLDYMAMYDKQLHLNSLYEEKEKALDRANIEIRSLKKKVSSQSDTEQSLRREIDSINEEHSDRISALTDSLTESREKVRKRDQIIDELTAEVKEKDVTIEKQKKKLSAMEALYDNAYEVGSYACNLLDMDFSHCLDMKINGYRTSYIFGDENQYSI